MKYLIICLLFLVFFGHQVYSQEIKELKIGQQITNIEIDSIIGHDKINLRDLCQKKLLIINFWATWCVPCVAEMKMLDSLKSSYKDAVNILSVTEDNSSQVKQFLKAHNEINSQKLLITTDSKILKSWFRHRSIPHNVWIDSTGTIIAITDNVDLNARNIKSYFDGNKPTMLIKNDSKSFNWFKPLHIEDSTLSYRSVITKYNPELNSGVVSSAFTSKRIFAWNIPLIDLYWLAYSRQLSSITNMNMVEIHTNDSLRFFRPKLVMNLFEKSKYFNPATTYKEQYRAYSYDHDFSYDLLLPDTVNSTTLSKYMFEDLERYFHVKSSIENRKIKCIIVRRKSSSQLKILKSSNERPSIQRLTDKIEVRNVKLEDFLLSLNDEFNSKGLPFINKTGYDVGIDIDIELINGKTTIDAILKQLSDKYGFDFNKIERHNYPVLVLKDK